MRALILLTLIFIPFTSLYAQVPDIGDNSIFSCFGEEDEFGCYGNIYWVTRGKNVRLRRARSYTRRQIQRTRRQRRKACRRGFDTCDSLTTELQNLKDTRADLAGCWNYEADSCDDSGSGGGSATPTPTPNPGTSNPNASEACEVVADPENAGERSRSIYQPRIANGAVCSSANNSPVVAMRVNSQAACTGTLISANRVLTAAHCLENVDCSTVSVRTQGGTEIAAATCTSHPNWTGSTDHDVAVLVLESSFSGITPVEVLNSSSLNEGERVVLTGYGVNEDDDENLRAVFNTISSVSTETVSTYYEVGDDNTGSTCVGDSGSPLLIFRDGKWKTIGTLSNGGPSDCAIPGSGATEDTSNWANITSSSNLNFISSN